jgi:hypothetical protein
MSLRSGVIELVNLDHEKQYPKNEFEVLSCEYLANQDAVKWEYLPAPEIFKSEIIE